MIHALVHIVLLLALPPLLLGIVNKTKALFAGRHGPPVLQLYYDLYKLVRKGSVISRTTSWVFVAGPAVGLGVVLLAGLLMPLAGGAAPLSFAGDLILFAYLLALGRFFTAAAALDTGSAFEGMGVAREVSFASLAEPALFVCFLVLVQHTWALSLSGMLDARLADAWLAAAPSAAGAGLLLVLAALFIVLLVENCRIPFDDPNTHLELTMIHEVMVLDHGGPALATILYAAAVKLFILAALVARVAVPLSTAWGVVNWLVFLAMLGVVTVAVGVVESAMARLRLLNVPKLLLGACLLAGLGLLLGVRWS